MFRKAVKFDQKLTMAITGPSGSGKTYTALKLARELAGPDGRIALVDTERGKARLYADAFEFDTLPMRPPYHPDRFTEAAIAARDAGYSVLIVDSLSHAWKGSGGALQLVDQFAARGGNTFTAWSHVTPIQERMIDTLFEVSETDEVDGLSGLHVIVTMRSKMKRVLEEVERDGRTVRIVKTLGMEPIQRDDVEYEFDVWIDMDQSNTARVEKSRCTDLHGRTFSKPGAELAQIIKDWLSGAPKPTQAAYIDMMLDSTDARSWAAAAYQIKEVRNAFESPDRVADWRNSIDKAGDVSKAINNIVWPILRKYASAIADGAKVADAWAVARDQYNAALVDTAAPIPEVEAGWKAQDHERAPAVAVDNGTVVKSGKITARPAGEFAAKIAAAAAGQRFGKSAEEHLDKLGINVGGLFDEEE